jgi:hypothetical protein
VRVEGCGGGAVELHAMEGVEAANPAPSPAPANAILQHAATWHLTPSPVTPLPPAAIGGGSTLTRPLTLIGGGSAADQGAGEVPPQAPARGGPGP